MSINNPALDTGPSPQDVAQALEVLEAAGVPCVSILSHCRLGLTDPFLCFAELIQTVRRNRIEILGAKLFGEASWDILLALYVAKRSNYKMTITAVCNEAGVPQTTALRWIQNLVDTQMIKREANPLDRRAVYVEITPQAFMQMDAVLSTVLNQNT